jgi:hypothetical protein
VLAARRALTATHGIGAIHYAVTAPVIRQLDRHERPMPGVDLSPESKLAFDQSDPEQSAYVSSMVAVGWFVPALACVLAMVLGLPVGSLLGKGAGDLVATTFMVGTFFCLAGSVNALWHRLWYVPQARRRLRAEGPGGKRFARSMRRSVPRNGSLVFQALVAIATVLLVVG